VPIGHNVGMLLSCSHETELNCAQPVCLCHCCLCCCAVIIGNHKTRGVDLSKGFGARESKFIKK
jgi:hypothetical protein